MSDISVPDGVLTFPKTASDKDLLCGVEKWVDLLSEARFSDAFELTAHDNYYSWTPSLIHSVIAGYGLPHEPGNHEHRVSKVSEVPKGPSPRWEVERIKDAERGRDVGFLWCDLPLDGKWSDLTATFKILQRKDDLILVLQDIHVH